MPGFDIQYSVEIFKEVGQKYKPDLVIWFESGHGFSRQNEYMTPIIRECYEKKLKRIYLPVMKILITIFILFVGMKHKNQLITILQKMILIKILNQIMIISLIFKKLI